MKVEISRRSQPIRKQANPWKGFGKEKEKIWIEWDGTEPGIAQELLDAGVPKENIMLAFYRPERRKLTELATA